MNKLFIFLLLLSPFLLAGQSESSAFADSLVKQLAIAKNDTNKIKLLDLISFTYSTVNPDEGLKYGSQAKELAEQLKWKKGIASAYSDLGVNYEAKSNHAKALENDSMSLKLYKELGIKSSTAGVLANISLVYLAQSNYSEALKNSFEALKLNEEITDKKNSAIIQENIGTIYMEQGKYPKAMEYYSNALDIQDLLGNDEGRARVLGNIGIIQDAQGNYAQALDCHMRALEVNEKLGNKISMQINMANIGNVYSHIAEFSKALDYHMLALKISRELGTKKDIAVNLGNIGETYFFIVADTTGKIKPDSLISASKAENLQSAISYLEQSKTLCGEIKYFGPLIEFTQFLSDAYVLSGNYKRAYETYVENAATKESVFSEQNDIKIKHLETQRELELKDKEIIIQNKQLEISKLERANKRNERLAFISGIVLLLLVIGIVTRGFMKRSKAHTDALSDIANIQSHQIRGPIARILGLTKLFNKEDHTDPINKELIIYITTATTELDEIVKQVVKKTIV